MLGGIRFWRQSLLSSEPRAGLKLPSVNDPKWQQQTGAGEMADFGRVQMYFLAV